MKDAENRMKQILSQDIQVSDLVNQRLQSTYQQLGAKSGLSVKRRHTPGKMRFAAAMAAIIICAASTAVYASIRSGFFEGLFGNATKKSTPAIERELEDGKGGKVQVTIPSKEYVDVDEGKAEQLLGNNITTEPRVIQIGEHKLTIENFVYDKNAALAYFTLERAGGVTALAGDEETNLTKGAYFTGEADFYFMWESSNGILGHDNTYIDMEKSTPEKMYCYTYILWSEPLEEGDTPQVVLDQYPCTREELDQLKPEEWKEAEIKHERIDLTNQSQAACVSASSESGGYLEYSPFAISIDLSKGFGLEAVEGDIDPFELKRLEIRYKDGSSYIVIDEEENIENTGYILGTGTWYKAAFNRLVDVHEIQEILVNEVSFPIS